MLWVDLSISTRRSALAAWPHINTATVAAASGEIRRRIDIAEPAQASDACPLGPEPKVRWRLSARRARGVSGKRPVDDRTRLSLWPAFHARSRSRRRAGQ